LVVNKDCSYYKLLSIFSENRVSVYELQATDEQKDKQTDSAIA